MINRIKSILCNYLGKKKSTTNSSLPECNFILLTMNPKDKEPYIKLNISDISHDACMQYAETLCNLNVGKYHQSFIDLLLEISNQDIHINKFIQSLIIQWGYNIKSNNLSISENDSTNIDDNKPIVSPMDFNKHAK
jgi:hypothetical protein